MNKEFKVGNDYIFKYGKGLFRIIERNGKSIDQYISNFYIKPLRKFTVDEKIAYFFECIMCDEEETEGIVVYAHNFNSLSWITRELGLRPTIAIGRNNKEYFRDSIRQQIQDLKE